MHAIGKKAFRRLPAWMGEFIYYCSIALSVIECLPHKLAPPFKPVFAALQCLSRSRHALENHSFFWKSK
jgi:hypothetical protein